MDERIEFKKIFNGSDSKEIYECLLKNNIEYHKPYKRFNRIVKVPRGQASYTLNKNFTRFFLERHLHSTKHLVRYRVFPGVLSAVVSLKMEYFFTSIFNIFQIFVILYHLYHFVCVRYFM